MQWLSSLHYTMHRSKGIERLSTAPFRWIMIGKPLVLTDHFEVLTKVNGWGNATSSSGLHCAYWQVQVAWKRVTEEAKRKLQFRCRSTDLQ